MSALAFPSARDSVARLPGYGWAVWDGQGRLWTLATEREEADFVIDCVTAMLGPEAAPVVSVALTYEEYEALAAERVPILNPELWRRRA